MPQARGTSPAHVAGPHARTQAVQIRTALSDREQLSRKLRISIVDHCNFGCFFCHNEGQGPLGRLRATMSVEEIARLCAAAVKAGIREIKLTGGEPLLYRNAGKGIVELVRAITKIREDLFFGLSMTTNGLLLDRHAENLRAAGLDRVTVSLHTLDVQTLRASAYGNATSATIGRILDGLRAARQAGLTPLKVNTVLFGKGKGHPGNLEEIPGLMELCRTEGVDELRLYTLLAHEGFSGEAFRDRYRFWNREMLAGLATDITANREEAARVLDAGLRFLEERTDELYPKPTLLIEAGKLVVSIEPMRDERFAANALSAEGPYSLRMSAAGECRGALGDLRSIPFLEMLRSGASERELEQTFRLARETLLPLEPPAKAPDSPKMTARQLGPG